MAVRGFRGVRDDLSELGRQFLDIACFLSPLLTPTHHDSPPPSPRPASSPSPPPPRASARALAGIIIDLSEISCGFRSGFSRLSGTLRGLADRDGGLGDQAVESSDIGVSEDVLEFVDDLVKCPESWLEFPVPVDDDCGLNAHEGKRKSNREATQCHVPASQSLASSATDKSVSIQQEHSDAWRDTTMAKTQSQQSIDRWSEVSGGDDGATTLHPDGVSVSKGNALVMDKYMDTLFPKEQLHRTPYPRRKHFSTDEENTRYQKASKLKMSSDEESSDWQAVEDSDFEVLEK